MADAQLLDLLRQHLVQLSAPGSEARLDMGGWTHCVGGYACRVPLFNQLGLRWEKNIIVFGDDAFLVALARFFDLTTVEAGYLFGNHPTATGFDRITSFADAIVRIDDILEGDLSAR